jgi:acyl carrier protein
LSPYAFSTANRFWAGVPDPDGADRAERRSRRTRDPEDVALDRMPDGPVSTDVDEFGDEVRGIVAEICGYDRHDVPPDALLFEELGYDSIMVVQLKARVEERWGLAVDGGELLPELTTPRRLIAFLRRHIQSVEAGGQRD